LCLGGGVGQLLVVGLSLGCWLWWVVGGGGDYWSWAWRIEREKERDMCPWVLWSGFKFLDLGSSSLIWVRVLVIFMFLSFFF